MVSSGGVTRARFFRIVQARHQKNNIPGWRLLCACVHLLKDNGETAAGVNATTSDVEVELADGNAHATDTKVTKTKDTRTIGHDNDLGLVGGGGGVLRKHLTELRLLLV